MLIKAPSAGFTLEAFVESSQLFTHRATAALFANDREAPWNYLKNVFANFPRPLLFYECFSTPLPVFFTSSHGASAALFINDGGEA
jgi:hypothetical protein